MPDNNFQIFNENNNQYTTMSDEEYASLDYRLNGLIPMIADPIVHNKMYRQWSIMAKAIANMICDKGYNALDTDVTDLKNNLKTSVKGLARDELQSDITTNANNITTNANNITALQTGKADIEHTHLTPIISKNGKKYKVYIRVLANATDYPNAKVGDIEAVSDSVTDNGTTTYNNILIPNCKFKCGKDSNNVTEITIIERQGV